MSTVAAPSATNSSALIGAVLAGILSWSTYHSLLWLVVDVILSWFFVIYWVLCYFGILPYHVAIPRV